MDSIAAAAPRFTARMAGLFYVLMAVASGVGMLARRGILVSGDAAATATNIVAHESMYRLAFGADLLVPATYLVVVVLFHAMLKPVNRTVSLLAASFGLMGCAIQACASLFQLAPLAVLGRASYLGVFTVGQLEAQAYLYLRLYNQAYGIALVFFGFFCVVIGYLIFKSTFLPRFLGVMMALAGLAWLTFLGPAFGAKYLPWIMLSAIGEALLALWLLVKGVDPERWIEQANAAATSLRR